VAERKDYSRVRTLLETKKAVEYGPGVAWPTDLADTVLTGAAPIGGKFRVRKKNFALGSPKTIAAGAPAEIA
jgi:hypothetical protein